jgi:hypothetical protein
MQEAAGDNLDKEAKVKKDSKKKCVLSEPWICSCCYLPATSVCSWSCSSSAGT